MGWYHQLFKHKDKVSIFYCGTLTLNLVILMPKINLGMFKMCHYAKK